MHSPRQGSVAGQKNAIQHFPQRQELYRTTRRPLARSVPVFLPSTNSTLELRPALAIPGTWRDPLDSLPPSARRTGLGEAVRVGVEGKGRDTGKGSTRGGRVEPVCSSYGAQQARGSSLTVKQRF